VKLNIKDNTMIGNQDAESPQERCLINDRAINGHDSTSDEDRVYSRKSEVSSLANESDQETKDVLMTHESHHSRVTAIREEPYDQNLERSWIEETEE
jgi:hypothetical protein